MHCILCGSGLARKLKCQSACLSDSDYRIATVRSTQTLQQSIGVLMIELISEYEYVFDHFHIPLRILHCNAEQRCSDNTTGGQT